MQEDEKHTLKMTDCGDNTGYAWLTNERGFKEMLWVKGVNYKLTRILLDNQRQHYLEEVGHPVPQRAITLAKLCGVGVSCIRSSIARLRVKGFPIKGIHGIGWYLDIQKQNGG